jgi:membrane protein YqaA with SNARE-associated domain
LSAFTAYSGLFLTAFGAATILPLQSEAALAGLLLAGYPPTTTLVIASVGNVLGSLVNYWLGVKLERFGKNKWFPVGASALERARGWYIRWGKWSLLLSWLPLVGDPLTLAAGIFRERLLTFTLLVLIAKAGRYIVLGAMVMNWT